MPELDEPWTWKVLLAECPTCEAAMRPEAADRHAAWHWLTSTETQRIEHEDES